MWESLYAWEKIRELELQLEAARPPHSVASAGIAELARPSVRLATAAAARLARALRRGGTHGGAMHQEPAPGHSGLDVLLEGRGPR